jgi:hypothetical protein
MFSMRVEGSVSGMTITTTITTKCAFAKLCVTCDTITSNVHTRASQMLERHEGGGGGGSSGGGVSTRSGEQRG